MFKHCSIFLADRHKAVFLLRIFVLLFLFIFVILLCLFLAALWLPVGESLVYWLSCDVSYVFVTFPFGVLNQVWYLIVSFP